MAAPASARRSDPGAAAHHRRSGRSHHDPRPDGCAHPASGVTAIASPPVRSRRTVLSVPGSNPRMLEKAQRLPVDEVFLDLEDAVAPAAKADARRLVVEALRDGDWSGKT